MTSKNGRSTWFDLPAADVLNAMSFYEGLFDWKFLRMGEPAVPDYWVIQKDAELIGGLRKTAGENAKKSECDAPVLYFTVENLAASVSRAKELGGTLVGERVDMGHGRGSYQWFRDRENNLIALWGLQ